MRTSGAEDGRSHGYLCGCRERVVLAEDGLAEHVGAVLALDGEDFLADAIDTPGLNLLFDDGIELFDDVELVNLLCKIFDHLAGKRVNNTEFKNGSVRNGFLNILIRDTRSDDTYLRVIHLDTVNGEICTVLGHLLLACLNDGMTLDRVTGHHNVFSYIFFIRNVDGLKSLLELNDTLRM